MGKVGSIFDDSITLPRSLVMCVPTAEDRKMGSEKAHSKKRRDRIRAVLCCGMRHGNAVYTYRGLRQEREERITRFHKLACRSQQSYMPVNIKLFTSKFYSVR
jgi:hypothetical protein